MDIPQISNPLIRKSHTARFKIKDNVKGPERRIPHDDGIQSLGALHAAPTIVIFGIQGAEVEIWAGDPELVFGAGQFEDEVGEIVGDGTLKGEGVRVSSVDAHVGHVVPVCGCQCRWEVEQCRARVDGCVEGELVPGVIHAALPACQVEKDVPVVTVGVGVYPGNVADNLFLVNVPKVEVAWCIVPEIDGEHWPFEQGPESLDESWGQGVDAIFERLGETQDAGEAGVGFEISREIFGRFNGHAGNLEVSQTDGIEIDEACSAATVD